jgi:general stress protein CsbA
MYTLSDCSVSDVVDSLEWIVSIDVYSLDRGVLYHVIEECLVCRMMCG